MGEMKVLYAIAESCPFDALLVRDMKRAVNDLVQLNLKRFRVPQKQIAKYSALDIVKQALELLFEFSPSEKNYREAMRTIQVYSEGDEEMFQTVQRSFRLIANAVYNAYSGQRQVESLSPSVLFLEGIPFDPSELQQAFRFVGVRPPDVNTPNVNETVFLDEGFEPYKLLLEGKLDPKNAESGREERWASKIEAGVAKGKGSSLIRAGGAHVDPQWVGKIVGRFRATAPGRLPRILSRKGISIEVIHRIADVNAVFGK